MKTPSISKLVLASFLVLSSSVFADDKVNWQGLYGSATVGRSWGHVSEGDGAGYSENYGPNNNNFTNGIGASMSGWGGNLKLGYNKQFDTALIGLEVGGTWQNSKSKNGVMDTQNNGSADTPNATFTKTKINTYETANVRLGYIFNDTYLGYVKGGAALGQIKRRLTDTGSGDWMDPNLSQKSDNSELGYVLGFGVEHKINDKWSLRADYEYVDFGNVNFNYVFVPYPSYDNNSASINQSNSIHFSNLSAGVSYAF